MAKHVRNIFDYLFVFFTIISCNSVYMNLIGTNTNRVIIVLYCVVLIISLFIVGLKRKAVGMFLSFLIIYYFYLLVFYFFNNIGENDLEFISYFGILLPIIVLYFLNLSFDEIKSLLIKMKKTILLFAIISLVLYILTNINFIENYEYKTVRWSLTTSIPSVMNIYFMPQGKLRNSLFFTEPAMYSIFLSLAMAIERIDKKSKLTNFLLFITILTTRSATGILLAFLILIFDNINIRKKGISQLIAPIIVVICLVIALNVFSQKTISMSYQIRIDDYRACIQTWKQNPIFGTGFMNNKIIQSNMSYFRRSNQGLSNSFFVILAQGGIYLLAIYVLPLTYFFKRKVSKDELLIVIVFCILLFTTIFHYTVLAYSGIAIGLATFINDLNLKKGD